MYNAKLLNHFQYPRNVGHLDGANVEVEVCNPICGDILRLSAYIREDHIDAIHIFMSCLLYTSDAADE